MTPPHGRRTCRVIPAVLGLVLYLAGTVAVPLVHAETEVLHAPSGIEQSHSESCARIHSDATCLMVTSYQVPGDTHVASIGVSSPHPADEFPPAATHLLPPAEQPTLRVRAPPTPSLSS